MNVVSILNIYKDDIIVNSHVTIRGWVKSCRNSKLGLSFISIYDGSYIESIQVIAKNTLSNYDTDILRLTTGCSVIVSGKLILSIGNQQKYEIQLNNIQVIGWIENPDTYPVSAKKHSMEHLRKVAHLRSRTNLIGAISRIRNHLMQSLHRFFDKNYYFWIPTPIITTLNAEGAGDMFRVSTLDMHNIPKNIDGSVNFKKDFFGKESFLTVSGQLNIETYACALSKVYTFGPTFRAENSNTVRHLAEFWMLEVESAFSDLNDILDFAECMLKYISKYILKNCLSDINFLQKHVNEHIIVGLEKLLFSNYIRIDYTDVINILSESKIQFKESIILGNNLSSEHERFIVDKYFKKPVIIKNYPKELKAFYMRLNNDNKTVAAMDLLVPNIGELIGGSQREERISILDQRLLELRLKKEDYWWYRDLRRYGTVPHAGFGMGFERLLSYITGVSNIRDLIPFPRTVNNANF
ncbi:asparagine--tRNA ligase [Buchnera aphidicola]|uniref:Asparagine--tRNA ligase n=1 Tax=Buchnera aphidicola subsp. Uroleucon sonchi TaxID=118118 RepID=A0A6C1FCP7_BUCUN|nr:asparagine--tRNA ligase [Buchnera aphidicola]QIE02066.1 asparagine--tRNA ligase [Buchnera aphidicola (Uroleucon sonchi)]